MLYNSIMKEIILTKGKVALVDDEDHEMLSKHNWHYTGRGYAERAFMVDGIKFTIYMHNQIMSRKWIDHIDNNPLNNQRNNLRVATPSENQWNRKATKRNSTGVKGLSWQKRGNMWKGSIMAHGKTYQKQSKDRAIVEQWLATKRVELHGEFARD